MSKFHINQETGEVDTCRASKGRCPFGGSEDHYSSKKEARTAYENKKPSFSNTDSKEKVYKDYRRILKAQPRSVSSRAGDRKQKAREIITQKYGISHKELKGIVSSYDEQNNIRHEDKQYMRDFKIFTLLKEKTDEYEKTGNQECPKCKRSGKDDRGQDLIIRPRIVEMGRKEDEIPKIEILCYECHLRRIGKLK